MGEKTIVFYTAAMTLRGTEIALFDYAWYNQTLLKNKSIIVYDGKQPLNDERVIDKFRKAQFKVYGVESFDMVDEIIKQENANYFYSIKGDKNDGKLSKVPGCKNLIHMTGHVPMRFAYGDVFAYVSDTLNLVLNGSNVLNGGLVVPHIVNLPDVNHNFREKWGIPESAFVYGRTGGMDTFNIAFVPECIRQFIEKRTDVFFCLQNTPIPFEHERIIKVPEMVDPEEKVKFINTCDVMLHARSDGETFGIAIGEFSLRNKPILIGVVPVPVMIPHHIRTLGKKSLIYRSGEELSLWFDTLSHEWIKQQNTNWNCYQEYSPENVMKQFESVFLNN